MSKLLIASGCSYTDQEYHGYSEHNIITWPELVAKELNIEFVNVALRAAPNDYICNSLTDAIFDYSHRDIIIMVLWTDSNRWYPIEPPKRLRTKDWLVTYQLRCMWRLNELCKQQKVPLYQGHSTKLFGGLSEFYFRDNRYSIEDLDLLLNNRYYNDDYFGPQNPWSNMMWMDNETYIIPDDGHPNQKGHDWIAEYFLMKYEGGDFKMPSDNHNTTKFVYD